MSPAPHPRMHGLTHVPGGPDPIPGLPEPAIPSFPTLVGDLAETRDLRGYWRLGEAASPFADTSGHTDGPANATMTTPGGTTAMTLNVTGALPAADDDGAVEYNALVNSGYLNAPEPVTPGRFNFDPGDETLTVAAWIRPEAGSTTHPTTAVGLYLNHVTYGNSGWRVGVNYPGLTPFFQRRAGDVAHTEAIVTGAPMTADTWYFVVGTYNGTDGHKLYVNGALSATDTDTFTNLPEFDQGVWFGRGICPDATVNGFLGRIDEVSVWGEALTLGEIATLYEAGVASLVSGTGTTWHHGSGTPSSGLGGDGDYYLDTATGDIWFKAAGTWAKIWDHP